MSNTPDRPSNISSLMEQTWKYALAVGIVSAVLGIVVMVWPGVTLLVLAVILGIQLVLGGIYRLVGAIGGASDTPWMVAFVGVLLLIGGVVAIRNPGGTVEVLTIVLGLAWLLSGVVQLVATLFATGYPHRGWMLFYSIISIIAGLVVLSQPNISIQTLAWVSGLFLVIGGVTLVFEAFAIRPRSA